MFVDMHQFDIAALGGTSSLLIRRFSCVDIEGDIMIRRLRSIGLRCLPVAALCFLAACSERERPAPVALSDTPQHFTTARADAPQAHSPSALPDFTELVEMYGDTVVNVEVAQRTQRTSREGNDVPEDPMYDFFRRFGIPPPGANPQDVPPARGTGSGFIVSPDGYILTNAHVVANTAEVTVRLTDRREFPAKVVGTDARTDIAVLKIDARDLSTVQLGDSNGLRPGQWVLAIGSPFGLDNSATAGIVSATSRAVGAESYVPFIQTDVAVNPGNSGGPLFNLAGEVVGINSMIFSRTGGYMGLSFAIPIDVAIDIRDQIVKTGRVVRGRIGVAVQDVNAQLAQSFGLDRPRGALVSAVEPNSPAAKAGLKPGDVILSVNDRPIDRYGTLAGTIAAIKPGEKARLRIWHDGKEVSIDVRVAELNDDKTASAGSTPDQENPTLLGLTLRPMTPQEKQETSSSGGLVVENVGGAAAAAGIQPGDIVVGVNGQPVASVAQLRKAAANAKGTAALLVQRDNTQIFVPVPAG